MKGSVVLEVQGLHVQGPRGQRLLEGVDLTLRAGEITAIVGETGSGKTTLINSMLGLLPRGLSMTQGTIILDDGRPVDLARLSNQERRHYLGTQLGYVPQDVRSGLNPLMTAEATVTEAAKRGVGSTRERVRAALLRAGLPQAFVEADASRRPGKLSGGQCQRVLIAQAIVNEPRVLLLDEPTASLDPRTRREVQDTIRHLANDNCAIGLVTHDIAGLSGLADHVAVMYLGRIVESGTSEEVLQQPLHPYTIGLLGCIPRLDRREQLQPIPGDPPASSAKISGCRFHPRCSLCQDRCRTELPELLEVGSLRKVACHVVSTTSR